MLWKTRKKIDEKLRSDIDQLQADVTGLGERLTRNSRQLAEDHDKLFAVLHQLAGIVEENKALRMRIYALERERPHD